MSSFDLDNFNERLKSAGKPDKVEWTRKIINTQMPVLAVQAKDIAALVKSVASEDLEAYLESEDFRHYENTIVYAKVMSKLKDFDKFVCYLNKLMPAMDNWATVDAIEWRVTDANRAQMQDLCEKLVVCPHAFSRRTGVRILFEGLDDENFGFALDVVRRLKQEGEYYVNMCVAWLLCEGVIKQRARTLEFLESGNVNEFVLRKTVSKCRDSFRVSDEDKQYLKTLLKAN